MVPIVGVVKFSPESTYAHAHNNNMNQNLISDRNTGIRNTCCSLFMRAMLTLWGVFTL